MRARNRLGALQMRIRRHDRVDKRIRLLKHGTLQVAHHAVNARDGIYRPHPRCRCDLIVPAASRVQSRCDIASNVMQEAIDHGVDVFIAGSDRRACANTLGHHTQSTHELHALVDREHFCTDERLRPGLRQADVVRPQSKVDPDRPVYGIKLGRRPFAESGAPKLVSALRVTGFHDAAETAELRALPATSLPSASRSFSARTR